MRWPAALLAFALTACSNEAPSPAAEAEPAAWSIYVCRDGRIVQALYPDSRSARVRMPDGEHALKIAVSGSGARYVGEGVQWWIKGDEGMLARLEPGEDIAAAPGVACVPPGRAPVEPPAPGTPGGLPDDRTPLDERPAAPGSGQAAATVVETYYALVESGRSAEAAKLRRDGEVYDVRPFARLNAQVGAPGPVEGAAGSLQVEVPVVLYGRFATGGEYHASGKATLRRANDTPGATAEARTWRIEKIEVKTAP